MKKILIYITFCLVVSLFHITTQAEPYRLAQDVIPLEQSINLHLNPDDADYSGDTSIKLKVVKESESFFFHSETIEIVNLILTSKKKNISCTYEQVEENRVKVIPTTMLELGEYLLEIEFVNNFDTQANAVYRMETEGESYVFSQLEADEAREAFPCFDEPIFKIPYQLTMTVPEQDFAVTNTPIESQETIDGWTTYRFKKSKPMPSYLIAVAVGPFEFVDMPDMPIPTRVVTPKGMLHLSQMALETTPPILKALEKYFDRPYPYEKLDLIAVPEFWPGAMENVGAITYSAGILLVDNEHATSRQKLRQAAVTAHELAHMWFGDLVTMVWWDDLWLNESFANWMGNKITNQVFPEFELEVSRATSANGAMVGDARQTAVAIRQPIVSMADLLGNIGVVYNKGEAVLNMFEKKIGEEKFRAGILKYIDQNAWGNATADDLWHALKNASDFDLPKAMETFINQPGLPLVIIEQLTDNEFKITQKRFGNYNSNYDNSFQWQIPLSIKYSSGSSVKTKTILLTKESQTISFPSDGKIAWVMPNVNSDGYFRWTTSPENLVQLATNAQELMTPRERIGFLLNLVALLDAGQVNGGDYLQIISHFKNDPNMQVMSTVLRNLGKVVNSFLTDELRPDFAVFVNKTLQSTMDKVGFTSIVGESERVQMLRPSLIYWLADHGRNAEALSFAEKQFKNFMDDPDSVDPSIISISVALACIRGDMELFNECKSRFENATTPAMRQRYLGALGSFEDENIQDTALQYALNGPLRPQEFYSIPGSIAEVSSERADYVFDWIVDNYTVVCSIVPVQYHSYLPMFAGGCSAERIEIAKLFFGKKENQVEGTTVRLAKTAEQTKDCITLRDREKANVEKFLHDFVASQ